MKWNLWKHLRLNSTFLSLFIHVLLLLGLIFLLPAHSEKSSIGERSTGEVGIVYSDQNLSDSYDSGKGETTSESNVNDSQLPTVEQIITQQQDNLKPQETEISTDLPSVIGPSEAISELGGSANPMSGASGKPGGGAEQGVTGRFMGSEGTGTKFIYVLDRSSSTSIGGQYSPLAIAKRELNASLTGLLELGEKEDKLIQFQIIFFNNKTEIYNTRKNMGKLPILDEQALGLAQRFVSSIVPAGGTDPGPALAAAFQERGDVIFFLTDGETKISPAELSRLRRLSHGEQVNVIEYGTKSNPTTPNSLQQLARENRGSYTYVDIRKYKK